VSASGVERIADDLDADVDFCVFFRRRISPETLQGSRGKHQGDNRSGAVSETPAASCCSRALDHTVSTIDVLADVVEAVSPNIDVVIDSGFMQGPDVCKALAFGAKAVGLGRLQCWALGVGGQAGMTRTFEILREEIRPPWPTSVLLASLT
jgi:hypothetical protein